MFVSTSSKTFHLMLTERLLVPDDTPRPAQPGENKSIRLLQYANSTIQESFDAFLTHHALVHILSRMKQIRVGGSQFGIRPEELFLIPKGKCVVSGYITGKHGFRSLILPFNKRVAQGLAEQLNGCLPERISEGMPIRREAIKIVPYNRKIEKLLSPLEKYSKDKSPFMCELIWLKFTELVYLLLDSPYQQLIASFLLGAVRNESPVLSVVLDRHLYSPATVSELAMLSGRSLSSFEREFAQEHDEALHGWICRRKLKRTAHLLGTSDKMIEEVTDANRFVSATHFARFFKEQYQMIPTEYGGRNGE